MLSFPQEGWSDAGLGVWVQQAAPYLMNHQLQLISVLKMNKSKVIKSCTIYSYIRTRKVYRVQYLENKSDPVINTSVLCNKCIEERLFLCRCSWKTSP